MSNDNIPDWLAPFEKDGAYTPTREFLEKLVPQSRLEAIFKYGFLAMIPSSTTSKLKDSNGTYLLDSGSNQLLVRS